MNGGGPLESSVTLDEVFAVVGARRVPLAPELAGYLVLEVTDHADPHGGDVDPRSVYVGEEGTVALVKPKREGATGDAEASIRAALARLLDASGSQTPSLAAASKRKSGAGLPALAEELEAALIPVNRAAGRRALARLAREVKRVTLGVGRNALSSSSDSPAATARSPGRTFSGEEEPTTARGQIPAGAHEEGDAGAPRSRRVADDAVRGARAVAFAVRRRLAHRPLQRLRGRRPAPRPRAEGDGRARAHPSPPGVGLRGGIKNGRAAPKGDVEALLALAVPEPNPGRAARGSHQASRRAGAHARASTPEHARRAPAPDAASRR